jgi:hypothetical protein
LMEIPFSRWYAAIGERRSRRQFAQRPVNQEVLKRLDTVCKEFKPFTGVKAVLMNKAADMIFKGVFANYGKVKNAPALIAFVGNKDDPNVNEKIGYLGEGIVLEATALSLGTCWVGAAFRPEVAASFAGIKENEKVFAVTPIGYVFRKWSLEEKIMTAFGRTHRRKPLSDLITGLENHEWPLWVKTALEAARLAPSAVNRQPWRFHIEPHCIIISVDNLDDTFNIPKRLDCGIAMLHIEVASLHCGVKGTWEFLKPDNVARFIV